MERQIRNVSPKETLLCAFRDRSIFMAIRDREMSGGQCMAQCIPYKTVYGPVSAWSKIFHCPVEIWEKLKIIHDPVPQYSKIIFGPLKSYTEKSSGPVEPTLKITGGPVQLKYQNNRLFRCKFPCPLLP